MKLGKKWRPSIESSRQMSPSDSDFSKRPRDTRIVYPKACRFRVSGFGFRISGFGSQVSGFRFQVSGFGFRVSGFAFRVSGFGFRGLSSELRVQRYLEILVL